MKRTILVLCGLVLVSAVILGLVGSPVTPVHANGAFVVNSSADTNLPDSFLTLREAMLVANGDLAGPFTDGEKTQLGGGCAWSGSTNNWWITGGCGTGFFDAITFSPSITQVVLASPLPTLTDSGTFINGNSGVPRINSASVNSDVFTIAGDHIAISNLSIVNGYGAAGSADIRIVSGKDARVAYDYLGVTPDAMDCAPVGVTRNSYYGVYVLPNSSGAAGVNNAVAYIYGNYIGCHVNAGVYVQGADYVYVGVQPDGTTADGNSIGYHLISGVGYYLPNGGDGVLFQAFGADGVRLGEISNNIIYANQGNGIQLAGTGTNNSSSTYLNNINNNAIGVNSQSGIRLTAGAFVNLIGTTGLPNLFDRNVQDGITILNSNSNSIDENEIGMVSPPDSGNHQTGVYIENSNGNSLTGNIIANNHGAGVWIRNGANNILTGNRIGTNSSGAVSSSNGTDGIALTDGAANNTIGTSDPAHPEYRNLIKFNSSCGVRIRDGATTNTIDGNVIASNQQAGVCIYNASNNNYIGSQQNVHQYISGNLREGVYVEHSNGNRIDVSNKIGLGVDGSSPWGNGREGILLVESANNTIDPDDVMYNGMAGIAVFGNTATGNNLLPGRDMNNGGLPIDLGNDGATPNGTHTPPGPNNWLNYPIITSASGDPVHLTGTTCANCLVYIYLAIGNPATPGGGGTLYSATPVFADGSGNWNTTLYPGIRRLDITLLAMNSSGDTSEFSPRPVLFLPLIMR